MSELSATRTNDYVALYSRVTGQPESMSPHRRYFRITDDSTVI